MEKASFLTSTGALVVALGLTMTGCGVDSLSASGSDRSSGNETVDRKAEKRQPKKRPSPRRKAEPARWVCSYSITYNDDWHDDVLCTNGSASKRPYLRSWDTFVEESELMESAREFERRLNGG